MTTTRFWVRVGDAFLEHDQGDHELVSGRRIDAARAAVGAPDDASVFCLDTSEPERPLWLLSSEGECESVARADVPVEVREACALWLPAFCGRSCAEAWHDEAPATRPEGLTLERFRSDRGGLPAQGDVDWLRGATYQLLGRDATESERAAFGAALLERLYELTPITAAGDGEAA
jgi:hypothetical protein